jgi:Tfp pilus assembly protein PilW
MRLHNQKGITLIELLAAITITAFLLGLIFTVILQSTKGFHTITEKESAQENARLITEQIVGKVREKPYTITQDDARSGYVLKLQDNSTYRVAFNYDRAAGTLVMETTNGNSTDSLLLGSNLSDVRIDLTDSSSRINVKVEYRLQGTNPFVYQTAVYVPRWNQ